MVVTQCSTKTQNPTEFFRDFIAWYLVDSLHDVYALGNHAFGEKSSTVAFPHFDQEGFCYFMVFGVISKEVS